MPPSNLLRALRPQTHLSFQSIKFVRAIVFNDPLRPSAFQGGLDGIENKTDAREPVNTNIWEMSHREKRRLRIDDLPHNLEEAINELEKDQVIKDALGEHIYSNFVEAKRQEWQEYITQVSQWELDNYLAKY